MRLVSNSRLLEVEEFVVRIMPVWWITELHTEVHVDYNKTIGLERRGRKEQRPRTEYGTAASGGEMETWERR